MSRNNSAFFMCGSGNPCEFISPVKEIVRLQGNVPSLTGSLVSPTICSTCQMNWQGSRGAAKRSLYPCNLIHRRDELAGVL